MGAGVRGGEWRGLEVEGGWGEGEVGIRGGGWRRGVEVKWG